MTLPLPPDPPFPGVPPLLCCGVDSGSLWTKLLEPDGSPLGDSFGSDSPSPVLVGS